MGVTFSSITLSVKKFLSTITYVLFNNVLKWFLADVAFTLLPIAVIFFIKYLTYDKSKYPYLSPDWSFATIVFLGISITRLIKVKTVIQQDSSHKLYSGTRFFILMLIFSVIVLSLIVLRSEGLVVNDGLLSILQLGLLVVSALSLLIVDIVRGQQTRDNLNPRDSLVEIASGKLGRPGQNTQAGKSNELPVGRASKKKKGELRPQAHEK